MAEQLRRVPLLGWVIIASLGLHGIALVTLLSVEPAEHYRHTEKLLREGGVRTTGRAVVYSPEPKTEIQWHHLYELTPWLTVSSVFELGPEEQERLTAHAQDSVELFRGLHRLPSQPAQPLEIRFVDLERMNDPRYFDVSPGGVYYGRYFGGARIAYLTEVALEETEHVSHELSHYLSDTHGLDLPSAQEESRARRFSTLYGEFRRMASTPHVVEGLPVGLPPKGGFRHELWLTPDVRLTSARFLPAQHLAWLRHRIQAAKHALAVDAELPPWPRDAPLHLVVLGRGSLDHQARDQSLHPHLRYDPSLQTAYVSSRIFSQAGLLDHVLSHHVLRAAGAQHREELHSFTFSAKVDARAHPKISP